MASGCNDCGSTHSSYLPVNFCSSGPAKCVPTDSSCVLYTGANLVCVGKDSNTNLEEILLAIDSKVCETAGGWGAYNYNCLADEVSITTAAQFVDKITSDFCTLRDSYNTFVGTTYASAISNLTSQITAITNPNLTLCSATGITSSDTYTSILTKLADKICDLSSSVEVSTANWNSCYTVSPLPTTIVGGFNTLISQICDIKNNPPTLSLPTFNNVGTCLPGTVTSADSLVDTIAKIKTRLCQSPVFDINTVPWGCVANPNPGTGANIQDAFNTVVDTLNTLVANDTTFDTTYFTVTPDDCNGRTVTLSAAPAGADRYVASDASDTNPGTLADKLQEGTNISLDNTTTPGKIIVNATPSTDEKVKVNSSDTTTGYLASKLIGATASNGVAITALPNAGNSQVVFTPSVDGVAFTNFIFDTIENDPVLYQRFCTLMCGCAPCKEGSIPDPVDTRRVMLRVLNNSTTETSSNKITLNQNNPTVGWASTTLSLAPLETYDSGWFDVTSTTSTLTAALNVVELSGDPQNVDIKVLQYSTLTQIPASSSYNGVAPFSSTNFNLGSVVTDMIVQITFS